MRTKPTLLDWLAYRLFWWRWKSLLMHNMKLRRAFVDHWNQWQKIECISPQLLKHPEDIASDE